MKNANKRAVGSLLKSKQSSTKTSPVKSVVKPITKEEVVKLYELPQREGVKIKYADLVMEFHHLDGMYSYNIILEGKSKGKVFHLAAGAPLKKIGNKEYEVIMQ